jgi:1,4-alpha-glucan branching enzyme
MAKTRESPAVKRTQAKTTRAANHAQILRLVSERNGLNPENAEAIRSQVHFKLEAGDAQSVAIAGGFNDWNPKRTPLLKEGSYWVTTLTLPRGRYEYRFVVDGKWISDPGAKESVANPHGENNSVFSV